MKLKRGPNGYWHWCPGCERLHPLPDTWTFDGNLESPTFNPSFLQYPSEPEKRCHYFVHAGVIEFCGDSHHALAGTNVPLVEIPAGKLEEWGLQ